MQVQVGPRAAGCEAAAAVTLRRSATTQPSAHAAPACAPAGPTSRLPSPRISPARCAPPSPRLPSPLTCNPRPSVARTQFIIEGMFALRKAGFEASGFPALRPELDLVEGEDQITHELGLDEPYNAQVGRGGADGGRRGVRASERGPQPKREKPGGRQSAEHGGRGTDLFGCLSGHPAPTSALLGRLRLRGLAGAV